MKKVAVIGYGGMGSWHCKQILNSDVVELAGIYDIREERRNLAIENNIFVYESNESIFKDNSVDIIVVATPNDVHEELVTSGLLSGHNVICEKPVALSVESFDRMIDAEKKSGKRLSVHQNRRWDREFVAIKNVIKDNELGDAIRIESRVHGSRGVPGDWRGKKEFGGGMILDWGVHLIDQILTVFTQKIIEINCYNTHITNADVDDGFRLEMLFENGVSAYVEVGTYNFINMPKLYLQCEQGTCRVAAWNTKLEMNKLVVWNEKEVVPVQTSSGITKTMAPRDDQSTERVQIELPNTDVHDFYRNFCDAIDGKAEQVVKNHEVRRVLQVMVAAFKSDELHERVKVEI